MKGYKRLLLYGCLLAAVLVAMLALKRGSLLSKTPAPRDYAEIAGEGVLRIITPYSTPGYYIAGGRAEGFQYELSRAIASLSGLEVELSLEMSIAESFAALLDNRCDIIAQNIPVTSDMKALYLFTEPIVLGKDILVQRTAEANCGVKPVRNHLELAGKTIYVAKGSPALLRLKHLEEEIGDSVFIKEDDTYSSEQLSIMVAGGEIDYAVSDYQEAMALKNELPQIDIETDISFTQLQAWAVRKDAPALADSLNSWFSRMRAQGIFDPIYRRYYGGGE
ncbi:MAG: transporter substrate-binding domain-containing protein [Tannerellaceae bacterium]|jgi:membrane-bound lytic murein transglycosylase MltF|nr:transporter substrate-binding domain-containing protein [Tannerellaceae bacterium]